MSNYTYKARLELPAAALSRPYYNNNNPFHDWNSPQATYSISEYYCWGRFWEVYNLYGDRPQAPANLGKIKIQTIYSDHTDTDNEYRNGAFWFDASVFDYHPSLPGEPEVLYTNLDSFTRTGDYALGNIACAFEFVQGGYDYKIAITEKIDGNMLLAAYGYDTTTGDVLFTDISSGDIDGVPIVGMIKNPIYSMYDNIIQGHPMNWKWPFWMYKKIIEKRRGY